MFNQSLSIIDLNRLLSIAIRAETRIFAKRYADYSQVPILSTNNLSLFRPISPEVGLIFRPQRHNMPPRLSALQHLLRNPVALAIARRRLPTYGVVLTTGIALTWFLYEPQLSEYC